MLSSEIGRNWPGVRLWSLLRGLLCVVVLLTVQTAAAQAPQGAEADASDDAGEGEVSDVEVSAVDARARRHWHSGMAYLEEGDPTSALEAFNKAYQLSRRSGILLAIAVAHERRGDWSKAILALESYLRHDPTSTKSEEVRARIAELQVKYEAELAELRGARAKEMAAHDAPAKPSASRPAGATRDAEPRELDAQRLVGWSAVGVGVAAAAGAVALGLTASNEHASLEKRCGGHCTPSQTRHGRSLALASTLFTGLAGIGFGVGLWLLLVDPSPPVTTASWAPVLDFSASPSSARGHVQWNF